MRRQGLADLWPVPGFVCVGVGGCSAFGHGEVRRGVIWCRGRGIASLRAPLLTIRWESPPLLATTPGCVKATAHRRTLPLDVPPANTHSLVRPPLPRIHGRRWLLTLSFTQFNMAEPSPAPPLPEEGPDFVPPLPDEPEPELPQPAVPAQSASDEADDDDKSRDGSDEDDDAPAQKKSKGKQKSADSEGDATAASHTWQAVWGVEQNGKSFGCDL